MMRSLHDDYILGEELGRGGFGTVVKAFKKGGKGAYYAVKIIDIALLKSRNLIDRVNCEAKIQFPLKHKSILPLHDLYQDEENIYLVLEYCRHGDLGRFLKKHKMKKLPEPQACTIVRQVLDGLICLHRHKILHRDIKLANLLLDDNFNVKIGDFGLSTRLMHPKETHVTVCGTPAVMAPEVNSEQPHGLGVDVWGLGALLYHLLFGHAPVKTTRGVEIPHGISEDAYDLLGKLLVNDPRLRIRAHEAANHTFFRKYPYTPLYCPFQDSGLGCTKCCGEDNIALEWSSRSGNRSRSANGMMSGSRSVNGMLSGSRSANGVSSRHCLKESAALQTGSRLSNRATLNYSGVAGSQSKRSMVTGGDNDSSFEGGKVILDGSSFPGSVSYSRKLKNADSSVHCEPHTGFLHNEKVTSSSQNTPFVSKWSSSSKLGTSWTNSTGGKVMFDSPSLSNHLMDMDTREMNESTAYRQPTRNDCRELHSSRVGTEMTANSQFVQSTETSTLKNSSIDRSRRKKHRGFTDKVSQDRKPNELLLFSTDRLPPTDMSFGQKRCHILLSGAAVLEMHRENCIRYLRVTQDGYMVVYKCNHPAPSTPPLPPPDGKKYAISELPQNLVGSYNFLSKFVRSVQSKVFKIQLNTPVGICRLMESSPDDFSVEFFSGETIEKHKSIVTIDIPGRPSVRCNYDDVQDCLGGQEIAAYFVKFHDQCLEIEKFFSKFSNDAFPVIAGTVQLEKAECVLKPSYHLSL